MLFYFDDCWVEIEFDSAWYFVFLGDDDNLVFWSSNQATDRGFSFQSRGVLCR
jgi:hypothetical protein